MADTSEPGSPSDDQLAALPDTTSRMLAALLAAAERKRTPALVETVQPPVAVVNLPNLQAGVVLLARGHSEPEALKRQLLQLVSLPTGAVLHLVLVGGTAADQALLDEADRNARNPARLGVSQLDDAGKFTHVRGRRLGLLADAAKRVATTAPLTAAAIASAADQAQRSQAEAQAFASELEQRRPLATWILCGACVVFFLLQQLWARSSSFGEATVRMGAQVRLLVEAGEPWRLLSYAFLHGSGVHLVVNLIGLWSFGGFLERLIGWRRYVVLYAASALAGGLASAFIGQPADGPPRLSVGASGAIWGLMAAGLALVGPRKQLLPGLVAARLRPRLLSILFINIALSFMGGIDKWAHFGGGLLGFALLASGLLTRGTPAEPPSLRASAWVAVALMAASVAVAVVTGRPWTESAL